MVSFEEITLGLRALDALVKEASVKVISTGTIQPGHFLVLFGGEVEPVSLSHHKACLVGAQGLVDEVLLAHAEERILPAIVKSALRFPDFGDTLGTMQVTSAPTLLRAVDAALKGAMVDLIELRIGDGLGGKAIATLWGEVCDVEAALSLAQAAMRQGRYDGAVTSIIPNADGEVARAVRSGTRFFGEWRG
jgi:microcompartment protein CcmL/EutN